ncbi:DUF6350 family protein [Cellulomonas cellasea]|uniref:cell division protein PerM n=1 Tax=Cellulomonas cellasea TaxID=43670 RepID=UPI0025A37F33|nr:DUF6350 family protein [Cellulomonas cellasea]MDM8085614.1 DUF6350 family protein [Cellulomonas cellasea]
MTDPSGTDRLDRARPPRVLTEDHRAGPRKPDGKPALAWLPGLLAGLQGALLSLLVVVLPAVTAYVVTSADPANASVAWTRSTEVGAGLWLIGHGVPLGLGGNVLTLMPLGITCLALFTCYASARRSGEATTTSLVAGIGGYTAVTVVITLLMRATIADVALAVIGGAAVSATGLATGLARRPEAPRVRDLTRPLWSRVIPPIRTGASAGVLALSYLVAAAAAVSAVWVLAGRATINDIIRALDLDVVGGSVLAVAELAYVPNVVVWALAWLVGPGFRVGAGTSFTTTEVVSGPMPVVPLLGALPQPGSGGGVLVAAPMLLVLVGALAGWWLHRRLPSVRAVDPLVAGAAAALTAGLCAAALVVLASGGIGPGRMGDIGASPLAVGSQVGAGVLLGVLLVALPTDAEFRAACRRGLSRLVSRGSSAP